MLARLDWRKQLPLVLYALILLLFPVTLVETYFALQRTPMPELFIVSDHVHRVFSGSGAEAAGVQVDDVIRSINGQPIHPDNLSQQISSLLPGQMLHLVIERKGQRLQIDVPLVSVGQVMEKRFLFFSIAALIFWIASAVFFWKRFQRNEMRLLFLLGQAISLGLLYPYVDVIAWIGSTTWAVGISALGGMFSALFLFHFHVTFPVTLGNPRQHRLLLISVYSLGITLLAGWLVHHYLTFLPHSFSLGVALYITLVVIAGIIVELYVYIRRASPDGRRRLRLLLVGELIAGVPPALLYVGPSVVLGYAFIPEWLLVICLMVAPMGYFIATVRDNLFGIDQVLNHSVVYVLLSMLIIIFFVVPISLIFWLTGSWPGNIFIVAALLLVALALFERTRSTLQQFVDRIFYSGWYDYPGVVDKVSDSLVRSLEWDQLADILARQIPDLMQLRGAQFQVEERSTPTLDPSIQPQLHFPLMFENKTLGLWTVGPRRDEEAFSRDDLRILHVLCHQAAIATSNMLLVKGVHDQLAEIRANRELLAQVDRQLLASREEERASLARDLHDGPVQSLIALNFQLGMIQPGSDAGSVQGIREEVKNVIFDLRSMCAELRPPMLDTMGLGAALRDLALDWSSKNSIPTNIVLPPDANLLSLPEEVAVNLYRVAQEALSNVARHAEAHQVNLCLEWDQRAALLSMVIEDNGKGFVYNPADPMVGEGHLGLINMRERVGLFGGQWRIETAPGMGTRISATWRIPHPELAGESAVDIAK